MFTGLHVEEHELYDTDRRLEPGNTIFDELSERGYATGVFSSNSYITGDIETGLELAFDTTQGRLDPPFPSALDPVEYDGNAIDYLRESLHNKPVRSLLNGAIIKMGWDYSQLLPDHLLKHTSAGYPRDEVYMDIFFDWMRNQDGPWAACLNFMGSHHPYRAEKDDPWFSESAHNLQRDFQSRWEFYCGCRPWSELQQMGNIYDCVIRQTDTLVERVVKTLRRTGEMDNTLLVITSDHGDGLGEQSELYPDMRVGGHKVGANEVLLHVPLIVKYPGQTSSVRTEHLASLTNFPDVVRASISDEFEPGEEFTTDDFVLASEYGVLEVDKGAFNRYCSDVDTERFNQRTRVAYRQQNGDVIKELSGPDRSVQINLTTGDAVRSDGSLVAEAFEEIEPAGITTKRGTGFSEATESHLEDLGYM
jgi:arylsulfatase